MSCLTSSFKELYKCQKLILNLFTKLHTLAKKNVWNNKARTAKHVSNRAISSLQPHICIVGSGPAGFYTAQQIMKEDSSAIVDIYEKLPVPFGLVRYGVAPDHPEVKNVINTFNNTAQNERCFFIGNVTVGKDVTIEELQHAYTAVILCHGSSNDRTLGIPGEELNSVHSARAFVGWYNGLPEHNNLNPDLSCETAVVIGMGNVALDVARILLTPVNILEKTDITHHALEALRSSKVKQVHICGRRGPLQVAFTIKELREMIKLPGCRSIFNTSDFEGLSQYVTDLPRPRKRLTELMIKTALGKPDGKEAERIAMATNEWHLKCLRTPVAFLDDGAGNLSGIKLEINKLQGEASIDQKIISTNSTETIPCGLALRSIGYQGVPIDSNMPFNIKSGTLQHADGRVLHRPGLYCSGWIKTGPMGVILTTMTDGFNTGKLVVDDIKSSRLSVESHQKGKQSIFNILEKKVIKPVGWKDWLEIDKEETKQGRIIGQPREKIVDIQHMMDIVQ